MSDTQTEPSEDWLERVLEDIRRELACNLSLARLCEEMSRDPLLGLGA